MEKPLSITTHHLDLPASAEAVIRERAAHLEHFFPALVGCSVIVEGPGRHHRTGGPFSVHIDLRVPGGEPLIVNRQEQEDLSLAVRSAFDVAARQLEDFARLQRRKTKRHEPPQMGRIASLVAGEDYGFIVTLEDPSRELYFHRNSLPQDDFEDLIVGQIVRFHEEEGDEGPQASTVIVQGS
jgi:cold shock CspA family protein/ribosome-associated translation inhibitor RaiA